MDWVIRTLTLAGAAACADVQTSQCMLTLLHPKPRSLLALCVQPMGSSADDFDDLFVSVIGPRFSRQGHIAASAAVTAEGLCSKPYLRLLSTAVTCCTCSWLHMGAELIRLTVTALCVRFSESLTTAAVDSQRTLAVLLVTCQCFHTFRKARTA